MPPWQRVGSLDVLRGFAILGILIMNIQGFSMINAAYANPTAYGDFTGVNRVVWFLSHVFADQKFMTLFALLFGAGIALFAQKLQAQGRPAGWIHYRRMLWLLLIGLVHAHLFWYGDILISYALIGCVAFLFRNLKPGWLLLLGCGSLIVPFLIFLGAGASMAFWPAEALDGVEQGWRPDDATMAEESEAFRGSFVEQLAYRAPMAFMIQAFLLFLWSGWRAGGLMLIGMALLKWSILSAQKPAQVYARMVLIGAATGLPLILYGVHRNFEENWSLQYSLFIGSQWNYWGSLGLATSYVGLIMLAHKTSVLSRARGMLAAVGRMSLTNYLLQTLICTTVFYGHGFGWFGRLERWHLVLVVLAVWTVQIGFSLAWLRYANQGPFEWLWRRLTYWGRDQARKALPAEPPIYPTRAP